MPSKVPFQYIKCNKMLSRVPFLWIKYDKVPSWVPFLWKKKAWGALHTAGVLLIISPPCLSNILSLLLVVQAGYEQSLWSNWRVFGVCLAETLRLLGFMGSLYRKPSLLSGQQPCITSNNNRCLAKPNDSVGTQQQQQQQQCWTGLKTCIPSIC